MKTLRDAALPDGRQEIRRLAVMRPQQAAGGMLSSEDLAVKADEAQQRGAGARSGGRRCRTDLIRAIPTTFLQNEVCLPRHASAIDEEEVHLRGRGNARRQSELPPDATGIVAFCQAAAADG